MTDTEGPAGCDLGEQFEPDRVGQRPEHLDGHVPWLGDDPRRRELPRPNHGQRASNSALLFRHRASVPRIPDIGIWKSRRRNICSRLRKWTRSVGTGGPCLRGYPASASATAPAKGAAMSEEERRVRGDGRLTRRDVVLGGGALAAGLAGGAAAGFGIGRASDDNGAATVGEGATTAPAQQVFAKPEGTTLKVFG